MPMNLLRLLTNRSRRLITGVDDFLFPPLCLLCDSERKAENRWLCKSCISHLQTNSSERKYCAHCGQNTLIRKCTCHLSWEYPFDRIYSIFDYDECVQEIVQNIKYRGKKSLALALSAFSTFTDELKNNFDIITPVPLHWTRFQKRGYNQAEWFAKGIALQTGLHIQTKILYRSRTTGTQTKLDKTERRNNMKNAFHINEKIAKSISNKRILLADDVITTGATTASCTDVLLNAGCKSVSVISIARD